MSSLWPFTYEYDVLDWSRVILLDNIFQAHESGVFLGDFESIRRLLFIAYFLNLDLVGTLSACANVGHGKP